MYMPDKWIGDVWDKMDEGERAWYIRFAKAVDYGNMGILRELCEEAPSDQYEQLKAEIEYERHAGRRAQYTIPKERKPRYSELDYAWKQPGKVNVKSAVETEYYGNRETAEMYEPRARK